MPIIGEPDAGSINEECRLADLQKSLEEMRLEVSRLQAELAREKDKYRELEQEQPDYWDQLIKVLDLVPIFIYIADREELLYVNPALIDKLGYTPEECVGMEAWWVVAPEYRDMIKYAGMARMSGVNAKPYEIKLVHKDGRQIFGLLSSERILYHGRDAVIGFVLDIDKPKRMEEEVKRAARLEAMGMLAGGIAHDFNNMLTVIQGNASLLKKMGNRVIAEEDAHLLKEIEAAAEEAQLLTNQLLTFSKVGGIPVIENVSLQDFIYDLVNLHIRGSNIKCEINLPDELWVANVDRGQIGQVIQNLVINACQAMPQGGLMEISASNELVGPNNNMNIFPGHYLRIVVKDNGTGIDPGEIGKIFDPYYTTKLRGHGLGLATVYAIVLKHAGTIQVESIPGQGASFILMLPASDELPIENREEAILSARGEGRILVMDDEGLVRNTLGRMLSYLGYQVVFARNGAEAISKFEQARQNGQAIEAVIMDLTIAGGMGAVPTLGELKKLDPDLRAILTSGYCTEQVVNEYQSFGFCGLVPKPYRLEALDKAIHEALKT